MFVIILGLVVLAVISFYVKYKEEKKIAEKVTKNFPTPPRMPGLGFSLLTENILPDGFGRKITKTKFYIVHKF